MSFFYFGAFTTCFGRCEGTLGDNVLGGGGVECPSVILIRFLITCIRLGVIYIAEGV